MNFWPEEMTLEECIKNAKSSIIAVQRRINGVIPRDEMPLTVLRSGSASGVTILEIHGSGVIQKIKASARGGYYNSSAAITHPAGSAKLDITADDKSFSIYTGSAGGNPPHTVTATVSLDFNNTSPTFNSANPDNISILEQSPNTDKNVGYVMNYPIVFRNHLKVAYTGTLDTGVCSASASLEYFLD